MDRDEREIAIRKFLASAEISVVSLVFAGNRDTRWRSNRPRLRSHRPPPEVLV